MPKVDEMVEITVRAARVGNDFIASAHAGDEQLTYVEQSGSSTEVVLRALAPRMAEYVEHFEAAAPEAPEPVRHLRSVAGGSGVAA